MFKMDGDKLFLSMWETWARDARQFVIKEKENRESGSDFNIPDQNRYGICVWIKFIVRSTINKIPNMYF